MAPTEPDTAPQGAGIAKVRYDDGRVEEYDLDRPIYTYRVNRIKRAANTTPDDDPLDSGYLLIWIAAGTPGLNGGQVTDDASVRGALETWLETVADIDRVEPEVEGPPTKSRGKSRTSRG